MKRLLASTLSASMALTAAQALAATPKQLSAIDSDAKTMGWMQGFPPAADKTIRFTDPDGALSSHAAKAPTVHAGQ